MAKRNYLVWEIPARLDEQVPDYERAHEVGNLSVLSRYYSLFETTHGLDRLGVAEALAGSDRSTVRRVAVELVPLTPHDDIDPNAVINLQNRLANDPDPKVRLKAEQQWDQPYRTYRTIA